jgi:hypothetical protein
MKLSITFDIDLEHGQIEHYTDQYLAQLWHIAQANPADYGDADASAFVKAVGDEIVRRWMSAMPVTLYNHQALDHARKSIQLLKGDGDAK